MTQGEGTTDVVIVGTYPRDRVFLTVEMPQDAVTAISSVIAAHLDEFDEALAPFGLDHTDMLMPTWMRPVRQRDVLQYTREQ